MVMNEIFFVWWSKPLGPFSYLDGETDDLLMRGNEARLFSEEFPI
jgi:hypothetical protein